jgi:hypothetical protein
LDTDTMKMLRTAAALAFLLVCAPALAQQTAIHSVPIGKGAGNTGFNAAVPSTAGQPLVSNGPSADPGFGTIANSGFTPGAANTVKGSLNGTTVTDLPLPNCTGVNQALKYVSGTGVNCSAVSTTGGYDMPINLGLSAVASGNALTITLTQANGAAPSSGSPVIVPFRSTVGTTGTITFASITATQSITIPNGATLGTSNGVPFRVWIFLEYNAGVPELAVATCSNATTVFPCAAWEHTLPTTTTIGGSSNTGGTLYATAGVAADAVRIIGFCSFGSGQTVAGAWGNSCTSLQIFGPGIAKPGDVVQTAPFVNVSGSTTCTTPAYITTAVSGPITPTSAVNLVLVNAAASNTSITTNDGVKLSLANNGTLIGQPSTINVNTIPVSFVMLHAPGLVTTQTYAIYCQGVTGNGSEAGGTMTLQEIQG